MADQTQGSIEIDADGAAVMEEILDYDSYPEWTSEMKAVKVLSRDKQKRGKKVHYEVAQGPLKADYTLEYTYEANNAGVSWTFVEGNNIRDMTGAYSLEPTGKGHTKVTYRMKVDTPIPMLGFMKRQIEKKIIDVALKGLKKRVESKR
jgi:carbon monoxide dehydrogenase subunit G